MSEAIREIGLPAGYSFRFTGAVKILDETTRNLIMAFLLASIFMYMVLAAQFDSFLHPFTIMLSLPLSIPFALFSLLDHRPHAQPLERARRAAAARAS